MPVKLVRIGDCVKLLDNRNDNGSITCLMGISIDKRYIPSVANIIGTDLRNYKVIKKGQFACSLMQVSRDQRIPIAMYSSDFPAIISPAYYLFEINRKEYILPEYLDLWFKRDAFDREASFYAVGGVRGSLDWTDFCNISIPIPPIEEQRKIVNDYQIIIKRIALVRTINSKLFKTANSFFLEKFSCYLHEDMRKDDAYVNLGEFISVKHGYAFDSKYFSDIKTSKVLVSPGNIRIGGGFQNIKPKYYSDSAPYECSFVLPAHSVVVNMTDLSKNGDTLGFPAIIPNENQITFLHNQRVGLVNQLSDELPLSFVYLLLCSVDYRNYILATASGTTVRHTSPDRIKEYGFIFPKNKGDLINLEKMFNVYVANSDSLSVELTMLNTLQIYLTDKMMLRYKYD